MATNPLPDLPFGIELPAVRRRDAIDEFMREDPSAPRTFEAGVPMRDGVELAATVRLPPKAGVPAPAIVHGTPYDKDLDWGTPDDDERRLAAGYAVVHYDTRGRGKSEGEWHPFTMIDATDGHDVVEWTAAQDWCTGSVGVEGLSYDGWIVMGTVSQKPPHLKAAVPFSAAGRWQEELPYRYGCFPGWWGAWWTLMRRRIMDLSQSLDVKKIIDILPVAAMGYVLDVSGPGWQELMDHDTLDDLWRSRRWDGAYDFDVPCLHVTGWHDRGDIQGTFHHYEQMMATSPAADRQWLLVGPWSHTSTYWPTDVYTGVEAPGSALDTLAITLRFFDRFVKGEMNGVDDEPRVQLYDLGDRSWKVRPQWQAGTSERRLLLADAAALVDVPAVDGETSYRYDPDKPNGQGFDLEDIPWESPLDLAELEAQPGAVIWTSAPLVEDATVHGWGELELWATTDGEDTDWHVKLADVDASGRSLCIAWGCLRASYGEDASSPAPVVPGEPTRYAIELTPSFHTFKAGHCIRLVLASSEFPWFARNMNRFGPLVHQAEPRVALNTVLHGQAHPSCLRLPVED
jgi:uncharacterized protein